MDRYRIFIAAAVFIAALFCPFKTVRAGDQPKSAEGMDALFKAYDEIEGWIKEAQDAEKKQQDTLYQFHFIKHYYTKRAGIPQDALGKSVYLVKGNGRPDDYPEWLSQYLPGMPTVDEGTQSGKVVSRLKESLGYLKSNSEYYRRHPPIAEMEYLRDGMDKWRRSVIEYHNALDHYYETIAEFTKYDRYKKAVYDDNIKALDLKYAGRESNEVLQAKYESEKNALQSEWEQDQERKKVPYGKLHSGEEAHDRYSGTCSAELFNNLQTEFLDIMAVCEKNEQYMWKAEKLKDKELNEVLRKTLQQECDKLNKEMPESMKKLEAKYGKDWMDKCRDPRTGQLPGGLLKEDKLAALKKLAVKTQGQDAAKPKAEMPQDNLYAFLSQFPDIPEKQPGKYDDLNIEVEEKELRAEIPEDTLADITKRGREREKIEKHKKIEGYVKEDLEHDLAQIKEQYGIDLCDECKKKLEEREWQRVSE